MEQFKIYSRLIGGIERWFSEDPFLSEFNTNNPLTDEDYFYDEKDLLKIQYAIFAEKKLILELNKSAQIWQDYSWNLSASWLFTPDTPEEIVRYIESDYYFEGYEKHLKQ